ncbi:MAG: 5-bromo-4-chloroindolyl phosphate hydrolysis family protein [Peptoniphilaceae bacterium]|nr:5-bromo-4-chloroindolyl phosphate hydrolysis family protein [Peptoniphilaceae bacterium]MDY6019338.1 5-bromo-4-chloroindolyl phosphate hydrolysis family protein [Anaerococcus sp.]
MNNNNSSDKISKAINDAINNMNFNDISDKIKTSLDSAIKSTLDMIGKSSSTYPSLKTKDKKICAQKLPERSKASGLKILSVITAFIFGSLGLGIFLEGLDYYSLLQIFIGFCLLLFTILATAFSWKRAKFINKVEKNYMRFLRELGNNTVIPIIDLASAVQESQEETVNDLLYMMRNGYFHQARIVENDSLFILDIDTFKLYKQQVKNMPDREDDLKEELEDKDQKADEIIEKSKIYIDKINKDKESIKNRVFLDKVITISKTIGNIIRILEKYKDKAYALDKFMDYYLPTTAKLIDTYIEFEQMDTDDPKILNSMNEIDKSIATINEAYEKIQVELVSDRAMDIKTDIDTMNLLLNQEGLLKDDWSKE